MISLYLRSMSTALPDFRSFIKVFSIVSVLVLIAATRLTSVLKLDEEQVFIIVSWLLVAGITLGVVYGSLRGINAGNFTTFQGFFMGGIIGKMFFVGGLFVYYSLTHETRNMLILVPFGAIYIPYLILESVFLVKASKAYEAQLKAQRAQESTAQ